MKDVCKILCNVPGASSVDPRRPDTEDDKPFYEILDGEDGTFRTAATASSLIRDTLGPPGPFGVLPKSISYRVSNCDQQRKFDGIDLNQVLAVCLGDVEAWWRRESRASKSAVWLTGGLCTTQSSLLEFL